FAMLSSHFPFTWGHAHAWVILVCLMAIGAWTRHFFNLRHRGRNAWWILAVSAAAIAGLAIWLRPSTPAAVASGPAPSFAQARAVIPAPGRPCPSLRPTMPGYSEPPAGIVFDTPAKIEQLAPLIKTVAVDSTFMPPSNATHMTQEERDLLARW